VTETIREGFASRLQLAIDEAGYGKSQLKELAVLFEVSAPAVRKWLTGEAFPSQVRAARIAALLGVRRAWLFDNELPMRPNPVDITDKAKNYSSTREVLSISGEEFRLLATYRRLPKTLQKDLVRLMQDIQKESQ
jgi:transcriptional regulator with XRE-family HTH domain